MADDQKPKDFFRVELYIRDHEELQAIKRAINPDIAEAKTRKGEKQITVDAYLTRDQIDFLEKNKHAFKVIENATEVGKERQKEVGKGNRFEKESVVPKGLGKKTK